jgi:hypothetical protein
MRLRSSISLLGAILFGIFGGALLVPLFAKAPLIERPPSVQALISRLKTSGLLEALDDNPVSCGRVPKRHPPRDRCYYRSASLEVLVAWNRRSGQPTFLSLEKREPRSASPFAWADLATSFYLLCTEITPEQAASLADDALNKLLHRAWTKWDSNGTIALSPEMDGASRSITVKPKDTCTFYLTETTGRAEVRATLQASFRAH